MKKLLLSLIVALTSVTGMMAQSIKVPEPELTRNVSVIMSYNPTTESDFRLHGI